MSLGLPLCDSYGMSESTAICSGTANIPGEYCVGCAGKVFFNIFLLMFYGK